MEESLKITDVELIRINPKLASRNADQKPRFSGIDTQTIFKVTTNLRAGVVWANTFNKFDPTSPFGGYKESGMGREGGLHGLRPYLSI